MILGPRCNGPSHDSVPQWKRELMYRKRRAEASMNQMMFNNNSACKCKIGQHISKVQYEASTSTNERSVDHSRQPDFHLQQRVSLSCCQVRSFALVSTVVDSMKLLSEVGVRDSGSGVKSRARINSSRTDCIRENYVKHVIEMNEEKCFDMVRISRSEYPICNKVRSLSPTNEDNTSDSSEELQYGPGIVNKLKTKYMSMTLRDNQKKGVRPSLSSLRKASSLDNLIDEELLDDEKSYQISSVISCVNKLEYPNKESNSCVTVNFCTDLKRARSMETLQEEKSNSPSIKPVVVSKTKVTNHSAKPAVYDNGLNIPLDSIVNEDIIIVENSIPEAKSEKRRRSIYENKELPPPDVVKETLKIFENCQKKPGMKSWRQIKYESSKKLANGKPMLYPKPVVGKKPTLKIEENGLLVNKSPVKNGQCYDRSSLSLVKVNFEPKQSDSHSANITNEINSLNVNVNSSAIIVDEGCVVNGCSMKPVVQTARENGLEEYKGSEPKCKYRGILKPCESLPVRQIGVIRPLVSQSKNSPQELTPQEIEKNFINTKKSLDSENLNVVNGVVEKSEKYSDSVNSKQDTSSANKPSTLWIKTPWNQQQNTMVFNFKDRKEVPDYIENDGLLKTTNRERAKRILQEGGGTGYIILGVENGKADAANESSTDAANISCKDEWHNVSGPPSPCNIHFEGDNIVINGKSNLRKHPKEKKLRIQFNDTSTTFEYPSEASLVEEDLHNGSINDEELQLPLHTSSPEFVSCNGGQKMQSPLSGGSSLARYVPSKLGMGESFELGVTKSNNSIASSTSKSNLLNGNVVQPKNPSPPTYSHENCTDDYLKPATETENVAWSEESIPDLLF